MAATGLRRPVNWTSWSGSGSALGRHHLPMRPHRPVWSHVITATDLELRAGSRILLSGATLRVQAGRPDRPRRPQRRRQDHLDAGARGRGRAVRGRGRRERRPSATCPRTRARATCTVSAKDRVLSARGLDQLLREMEKAQTAMAELVDGAQNDKAVRDYGRIEERFSALGGYAAESDAARICAHLGLPDRVLQPDDPDALGRPAAPRRAGPDPVRGLGRRRWGSAERDDAAARRAHEPPRRRLDHLAALVPRRPRRRRWS